MDIPEDLRYTREHEWARYDKAKKVVTVGVTDYAQEKMGDVVYIELPDEGDEVQKADPFGSIESVKAVSDLFSPVSGTVVEINDDLVDAPEMVNEDAYTEAWMVKVKVENSSDFDEMMSPEEYKRFVSAEEEG